jgi:hypothetical protein
MDVLEFLYDYFEDRTHAAALIRQRRPFALGVLGTLAGGAGLFTIFGGGLFFLPSSWPSLLLLLLIQTSFVFLLTAVLHQLLDMTGARGDAGALFVHLGLSELAWLAAVPAILIARALAPHSDWLVALAFGAVGIGSLALKARGLRDEYGVGEGRAWLTLGLPYLLTAALGALGMTLAVTALLVKAFSS